MPRRHDPNRLSVILGDGQKAALEQLSRRVSFERGVDVTVSDLVRDAVAAYLERLPERRIARIAETKVAYEARP